jgi:type II secretory pathway predicted ATPase ExeA
MLSGVMEHFGFRTSLKPVAYYDSESHQQLVKDLKAAIYGGGLVAFTGIVGSGKTVLLARLQQQLRDEGQIEVCESLAFEVAKVTLTTLKLALYYDLATEKDGDITGKPEKSERALMKVMGRYHKPIALFIDDAHDLHGQTLRALKQMIEKTGRRGARLTLVLAGHPRLRNDLRRPAREETGARTTVFEFEGIQGQQRRYITWLLEQSAPEVDPKDIVTPDALSMLADRLSTPLQIEHYLTRILEQAYRLGEKPVTPAIVEKALAPDMHDLEPTLTRYGYNIPALSELLNIRQAEVRGFLHGQLPPGRTAELHQQLLAVGLPLGERLGGVEPSVALGREGQAALG